MNKIVDVAITGSRKAKIVKANGKKPIADLREWVKRVEGIGELTRVLQPVDRDEEMSAISYLVAKQQPSPAVLFEHPRGFEKSPIGAKMLWNILGPSVKRVALTLEEPADTPTVELIRRVKDKLKRRLPPHRGVCRSGARLRKHGHRKKYRFEPAADPAALAARWWPLCRHRRCGDYARSRQRLSQYRHLSNDAAGKVTGRALPLARQGCAPAHHAGLATGQVDQRRRRLGHRSAVHAGRLADISQERVRIRIRRRHQGPADSGRSRQDDRSSDSRQCRARH